MLGRNIRTELKLSGFLWINKRRTLAGDFEIEFISSPEVCHAAALKIGLLEPEWGSDPSEHTSTKGGDSANKVAFHCRRRRIPRSISFMFDVSTSLASATRLLVAWLTRCPWLGFGA